MTRRQRQVRWNIGGGIDVWQSPRAAATHGGMRLASFADRSQLNLDLETWARAHAFTIGQISRRMRSSTTRTGSIIVASVAASGATLHTPLDRWFAGDTGQVRPALPRGHPVLDGGGLQVTRLGRGLINATLEGQRWWPLIGPARVAAATFIGLARTSHRVQGAPLSDTDVGLGARLAFGRLPGQFRIDLGKGRDKVTLLPTD